MSKFLENSEDLDESDGGESGSSGGPIGPFEMSDRLTHIQDLNNRQRDAAEIQEKLSKELRRFSDVDPAKPPKLHSAEQTKGMAPSADLPAHPLLSQAVQFSGLPDDQTPVTNDHAEVQCDLQKKLQAQPTLSHLPRLTLL